MVIHTSNIACSSRGNCREKRKPHGQSSTARARAGSGKYLCVLRLHGFAASRTRNAAVPSAAPPAAARSSRERERRRPAGLGGGVDVGAGAQQRERALGREDLEVVERRRPEAGADEPGDEVVVAVVGGDVLRRVARRGEGEGAAGAVGGEELDDAEVAALAGNAHRRDAIVVGLVHVGVRGEQLRDDLGVALLAGDDQRRGAIVGGLVHVGVRSDQLRDDLGVALLAGDEQRRGAIVVAWFTSAFAASSAVTTSVWPFWQAMNSGVTPSTLSVWSTSASAASSFVTISVWPLWQAMTAAWRHRLSAWSTLAFAASSFVTTSVWPFWQAMR